MTKQEQEQMFSELTEKMKNTLLSKGDDYSNSDRLSNFKLAGGIAGTTPELNCLNLISTKVARLGVLLNGKIPNNESTADSVLDLANYSVLLYMLLNEKNEL